MTSRYWSGRGAGITRGGMSRGIPPSWSLGRPRNPDDFGYEDDWSSRCDRDKRDIDIHQWYRVYEDELNIPRNNAQKPFVADAFTDEARGFKRPYGPPPLIPPKRFQANTYSMPIITGARPAPPRGHAQPKAVAASRPHGAHHPTRSAHIFRGELFLSRTVTTRYDQAVDLVVCDIKESLVSRKKVIMEMFEMKKLKDRIRERLNRLLLDKIVPSAEEMHSMYRAKYGAEDDEAFLTDIKNSMDQDFVDYVKGNLSDVLNNKLDDMFNKVNRLYAEEAKMSNGNGARLGEDVEMKEEGTERRDTGLRENADYYRLLDYMLKEQLPKVLPQFKHHMISILCHDSRFTYTDDKNGDQQMMAQDHDKEQTKLQLNEAIGTPIKSKFGSKLQITCGRRT